MKIFQLSLLLIVLNIKYCNAQIITPIIKASFGIDADLRCNYFNGLVQSGNDDWFKLPSSVGTGEYMIDTTGAAFLLAQYASNPASRKAPFYKSMRFPSYKIVNNRLLIDGYFARDHHGDDSTMFAAGSNKNGMNPVDWSCPVSQPIPDKNEILDVMLHVRRAGPSLTDSLWMMGGISIENTTGNRYFDFEMYQTDFYYDKAAQKFYNYGPDDGHTRWQFDNTGVMAKPGDIIFTAEYSSSSLTLIEARIWINKNDLAISPMAFSWTGSFDGASAGSQFGYAGIQPKTSGAFYTGLQSGNNTWAGPFGLVLGNNSILTDYTARQYMEFSVNLTKIGLDQSGVFGEDDCAMPFRKVIIKTRSSTSFTSALKDFVAPFHFFVAPKAVVETATPVICMQGSISNIYVVNPLTTSVYQWSTLNGHIVGSTTGISINVDTPGVYIVQQYLQAGCLLYATDTIAIQSINCFILANNLLNFNSTIENGVAQLNWKVAQNEYVKNFEIERSTDGIHFVTVNRVDATALQNGIVNYNYEDNLNGYAYATIYYRLRITQTANQIIYSPIVNHQFNNIKIKKIVISPNPVAEYMTIQFNSGKNEKGMIYIYNQLGNIAQSELIILNKGNSNITVKLIRNYEPGLYVAHIKLGDVTYTEKFLIAQ
jgi:Secretion system C-terminal sorting domain